MIIASSVSHIPPDWVKFITQFPQRSVKVLEILFTAWEHLRVLGEDEVLIYLTDRFLDDVVFMSNRDQEVMQATLAANAALCLLTASKDDKFLTRVLDPIIEKKGVVIEHVIVNPAALIITLSEPYTDRIPRASGFELAIAKCRLLKLANELHAYKVPEDDNRDFTNKSSTIQSIKPHVKSKRVPTSSHADKRS